MRELNFCASASDSLVAGESASGSQNHLLLKKLNRFLLMLLRSFLIAVLIVGVLSYIGLSPPVLTTLLPGLVLCPSKPAPGEYNVGTLNGIKPEDIFFKNKSGDILHGWFLQSTNPHAQVLLVSHGNAGNVAQNAPSTANLLSFDVSVFIYDYRGYGKSSGKATMAGTLADGEAAYDYLTKMRKIAPSNIILYGGSFGGSVACHLAATKPAAALIIASTFSSLSKEGRKVISFFKIYPEFLQAIPALDNGSILKEKHLPVLIIHGVKDRVIPFSEAEDNYAQASQPKTFLVLPNSGHYVDEADSKLYQNGFKSFLSQFGS